MKTYTAFLFGITGPHLLTPQAHVITHEHAVAEGLEPEALVRAAWPNGMTCIYLGKFTTSDPPQPGELAAFWAWMNGEMAAFRGGLCADPAGRGQATATKGEE